MDNDRMDYEMASESNSNSSPSQNPNPQTQAQCPYRQSPAPLGNASSQPQSHWGQMLNPAPAPHYSPTAAPSLGAYWPATMPMPQYNQYPGPSGQQQMHYLHGRSMSNPMSFGAASMPHSTVSPTQPQPVDHRQQYYQPYPPPMTLPPLQAENHNISSPSTGQAGWSENGYQNGEPHFAFYQSQMPMMTHQALFNHNMAYQTRYLPPPSLQMSRNGPPPNASSNTNAGGTPTARQTRAPYSQTQAYRDGPPLDFGEDSDDEEFDVDVDVSDDDLLVEARARRVVDPTVARLDASTNSAAQVRDARLVVERERERDRARRRAHIFEAKMVASKAAIAKLEVVDNALLTEDNKVCAICYNDLGVKTPDGDIEVALRLPKCKHIFGDVCLKKWLEDSDSCPFCRDKLPSEPKRRKHHPRGLGAYTYGAYVAAMSQPYGSRRDPTLPDMDPEMWHVGGLPRFSRRAAPSGHRDAETSSSSVPDPTRATTSAGNERRRGHVRESAWHARANARMFTFERPGSNGGGQLDRSSRPRSHSFIPDISSESRDGPRSITPHPAALDSSASGPVLDPTGAQWRVPTSDLNRFRAERDRSPTRQMNARHRRLMRLHPVHRLEDDNMGPMNPYDELAYDSTDDEFTNRVLRRHMEATPQRSSQAAQNRGSNASTLPSQSSAPEAADATTSMAQYAGPTVGAGIEQIERERDLALQQLMYSHLQDQRRISEPRPDLDAMDGLNRNGYRGGQHREDDEDL